MEIVSPVSPGHRFGDPPHELSAVDSTQGLTCRSVNPFGHELRFVIVHSVDLAPVHMEVNFLVEEARLSLRRHTVTQVLL